ncbi:cupin domain-containing protein [Alteromonas mediterranea]|uniref:cupin domain-containing protein n=1 Tax=Alteromonas mediterranea TaxID=314275 RepID=UPI0011327C51|nr:cupin domain-containing protein [Alteromonas mediterranea]QDG39583.1 cupin domain-containing protein [Alteromonas mediterranea]
MSVLSERLVRYKELIPCRNAFIDTRSPGSDQKENFTIIGPGVAENPDQHVHIAIPHGFNIGGARQPPGCLNSQHSHLTEEVFVVSQGSWHFTTGVEGNDAVVRMEEGDIISIPMDLFRGFENVGDGTGYLYAVLGQDDPGRVLWAPQVFDMASDYGLVLLENGGLVDTTLGQKIPEGVAPMPKTSAEQIAQHRVIDDEALEQCVVRLADFPFSNNTVLTQGTDVLEAPLIGPASADEKLGETKLNWSHGFCVRALKFKPGAFITAHKRFEEEVVYVQDGSIKMLIDGEALILNKGDTFTTPIGAARSFVQQGDEVALIYVTRRGDTAKAPEFID